MRVFVFPVVYGLASFTLSAVAFGVVFAFLTSFLSEVARPYIPLFVVVPALLIAGYVGARCSRTKYLRRRLVMAAVTGAISVQIASLAISLGGLWWLHIVFSLAGAAFSVLGGLSASLKSNI